MTQKAEEDNRRRTRESIVSSTSSAATEEAVSYPLHLSSQCPLQLHGWDAPPSSIRDNIIGAPAWPGNSSPCTSSSSSSGVGFIVSVGSNSTSVNGPTTDIMDEDGSMIEERHYWAVLLFFVPTLTVFGNVLVVLSICKEKSLQTATNFFILSLAVSDLMVAILVMPLSIYVEVNNSVWGLGDALCDMWVALDVLCCTASILNLTAISVDRFIAVAHPIRYAKHRNSNRVYVTLALTWIVSLAISSPIALGMNYTERRALTPTLCTFYNSNFLIYSSMGSFYIPSIIMVGLYWRIFLTIRRRTKGRIKCPSHALSIHRPTGGGSAAVTLKDVPDNSVGRANVGRNENMADMQEGRIDDDHCLEDNATAILSPISVPKNDQRVVCLTAEMCDHTAITLSSLNATVSQTDESEEGFVNNDITCTTEKLAQTGMKVGFVVELDNESNCCSMGEENKTDEDGEEFSKKRKAVINATSSDYKRKGFHHHHDSHRRHQPKQKQQQHKSTGTKLKFLVRHRAERRRVNNKEPRVFSRNEKKATKTLAIVLGVFLFCWVPFFTINIMNAICIHYDLLDENNNSICHFHPILFSFFVWLGYINSFLNPTIYTIFNAQFRRVFKKLLLSTCRLHKL